MLVFILLTEPTVKPPPDLSELLRQEREAERIMAESQRARTPIQEVPFDTHRLNILYMC